MRLLYLDEAGTDRVNAPVLCVAGVLVHGDKQYPEIERRILALVEKYVPERERYGFAFHATDIYHGAKFFDRRKPEWADRDRRNAVLIELAAVIDDLNLPVVLGKYKKEFIRVQQATLDMAAIETDTFTHSVAAFDCLMHADRWLSEYSPDELARVTHEDGTPAKPIIKGIVRSLRNRHYIENVSGLDEAARVEFGLPITRIVDSVSFEDKSDARPLQLADLCAFIFGRMLKQAHVPPEVMRILLRQAAWMMTLSEKAKARASSLRGGQPA